MADRTGRSGISIRFGLDQLRGRTPSDPTAHCRRDGTTLRKTITERKCKLANIKKGSRGDLVFLVITEYFMNINAQLSLSKNYTF